MRANRTNILLLIVAALLTANLVVTMLNWLGNPPAARADLITGKNWFTTTGDDGKTVFLWQYWTSGGDGPGAKGKVYYYGRIAAGGSFQEN